MSPLYIIVVICCSVKWIFLLYDNTPHILIIYASPLYICRPCVAEWSCDDRLIFTIGRGHTVYVWLSENLTVLHTFETRATIRTLQPNPIHPFILNVVFSQGGMELWNVDGSTNNRYLDTYEVDNNFTPNSQFCWAEWSKDGTMLAARSFKNTLTLYSLYQGIARVDCLIEKN